MPLEDLREFLQESISSSFQLNDDAVIEQLQAAMSELRKMKLDLPPARMHHYLFQCTRSFITNLLSLRILNGLLVTCLGLVLNELYHF